MKKRLNRIAKVEQRKKERRNVVRILKQLRRSLKTIAKKGRMSATYRRLDSEYDVQVALRFLRANTDLNFKFHKANYDIETFCIVSWD